MANISMELGTSGAPLEAKAAPVTVNGSTAPSHTPTQPETPTLPTSTACPLSPSDPSTSASAGPLKPDLSDPQVLSSIHSQPNEPSATVAQNSDNNEDDLIYDDQDGAQSFIQPAISARAARLTSPNTPAAEKAAAMDYLPSLFDFMNDEGRAHSSGKTFGNPSPPMSPRKPQRRGHFRQSSNSRLPDLPTPWRAEPKQMIVGQPHGTKTSSMFGVFGNETTRSSRAASAGENALKKLSKALPSISLPTPSFFSSSSSSHKESTSTWPSVPHLPKSATIANIRSNRAQTGPPLSTPGGATAQGPVRSSSLRASRPPTLRHSTSDDSLLYQSLTRVSSLGDDERFANVREQVNTRIKAIIDSFEPSFKLPQLPKSTSFTRLMAVSRGRLTEAGITSPLKKVVPSASDFHGTDGTRSAPGPSSHRPSRETVHPLDAILETLTGDIVVMGGYRGSILRSAEPPYRQLWVPVKVGLNIRKVNMEVGLEPEDEENMEKYIFASGMLQNIGPIDISRKLFRKLRDCENSLNGKLRVHDYGYDWRLSPYRLSKKLNDFVETLPSNQPHTPPEQRGVWVIAHSLGGVITRHAVNQRPDLYSGIVFAGVPNRCINILGPLRNGDAVLFNETVLKAQSNFSFRSSFVFLPEDGFCFVSKDNKEEFPVDFYNVDDWIKYRLSPCVGGPALPPLNPSKSTGTLGSLLSLSDSFSNLSSLPFRGRSNSGKNRTSDDDSNNNNNNNNSNSNSKHNHNPFSPSNAVFKDRTIAPQMGSSSTSTDTPENSQQQQQQQQQPPQPQINGTPSSPSQAIRYLTRTLRETKQFRSELAHNPSHQRRNAYPPLSVIYAKDIPTVYAARVSCREAIACTDAYDDLVFASGDGVVLARESMLPEGYELVKDGRVCTDRGHVSMLGDLAAVGRALEAVVRGRRKGIGRGGVEGQAAEASGEGEGEGTGNGNGVELQRAEQGTAVAERD